jgi:hypothetical protein
MSGYNQLSTKFYLLGRVKETSHQVKLQQVHWVELSHPAKLEENVTCKLDEVSLQT